MFDYLLLLSEGRTIYYGLAQNSVEYFRNLGYSCPESMNPADFLLDMLDPEINLEKEETRDEDLKEEKQAAQVWEFPKLFLKSPENTKLSKKISLREDSFDLSKRSFIVRNYITIFQQYLILTARTWRSTVRDTSVMYIRTAAAIGIGLLVGGIFFQQPDNSSSIGARINTMLFLMCVFSLFCVPAISRFIKDKLLFTRERAGGFYGTTAYFLSTLTVEIPILLGIVIGYGCVSYWMVGLQPDTEHFIYFLALIFVVINVGFSVSQVISAGTKSATMAIAIYMIVLVYSLLLGGFIVRKSKLPGFAQWAVYTSYFWYGFQGLILNEFEKKPYGEDVIKNMDMGGTNKYTNLGMLGVVWILLELAAFLILHYISKEKR